VPARGTDLLDRALKEVAPGAAISVPADEPDVRQLGDSGAVWADIGDDGNLRIRAGSRRFKNDWGTAQQRTWTVDPDDWSEVCAAVAEARNFLA
jgi:hypothetical protein